MMCFRRVLFLVLAGVLSACATAPLHPAAPPEAADARFDLLEQRLERELNDISRAPAASLYYLCLAYSETKRYIRLFACLDHLETRATGPGRDPAASRYAAAPSLLRSRAWLEQGRFSRALAEARRAEPLLRTPGTPRDLQISGFAQLGILHALAGNRGQALRWARALDPPAGEGGDSGSGDRTLAQARVFAALGDFAAVNQRMQSLDGPLREPDLKALARLVQQGGPHGIYRDLPQWFLRLHALLETGRRALAKAGFDLLLTLPPRPDTRRLYWMALRDRGRIAEQEQRPEEALGYYLKALDRIEELRSQWHTETSRTGLVAHPLEVYRRAIVLLVSMGDAEGAFQTAERARAQTLVTRLAGKKRFPAAHRESPEARELLDRLVTAEQQAALQDASEDGPARLERVRRLRRALVQKAPRLSRLLFVQRVKAADVQKLLDPQEAFLEYFFEGETLIAFLLDRQMVHMQVLKGRDLERDLNGFLETLRSPRSTDYLARGKKLYRRLIQPLEHHLNKPVISLAPQGPLAGLPFNALYNGEKFLFDRFTLLRLLPGAPGLIPRPTRTGAKEVTTGVLVVGRDSASLPFATEEAKSVGKRVTSAVLLLNTQAKENRFKELAPGFSHLHLCTEGRLDPEEPLQTGLAFDKDPGDDGWLTLPEIYDLPLGARLVLLSGPAGASPLTRGDPPAWALPQAFLFAGADSVVYGVWPVQDRARVSFMEAFYGAPPELPLSLALKQAQMQMRNQYPHPYYWAGFQWVGRFM